MFHAKHALGWQTKYSHYLIISSMKVELLTYIRGLLRRAATSRFIFVHVGTCTTKQLENTDHT